jgi:hypothetical protein
MTDIIKNKLTEEEKKEKIRAYQKAYRERTKEKRKENYDKEYHKKYSKKYFQDNKEKLTLNRKKNYHLRKIKLNPELKDKIKEICPKNPEDKLKEKLKKYLDIEI